METDILLWITWGFGVFITLVALKPIVRENHTTFNAMTDNFIKLMVVLAIMQAGGFAAKYFYGNVLGFAEPIIAKNLRIDMIVLFGILAVMLHFTLYAMGFRRHYGLPWIWYLFIIVYFIQLGNTDIDVPIMSSAVVAGGLVCLYLYKAFKNRSGLMFGIALYIGANVVFAVSNQYIASNLVSEEICDLLGFLCGSVVLAFATWDVYDRYLLYDRAQERSIKSTWIAKLMQPAINGPQVQIITGLTQVKRHVTCPVCKADTTWEMPKDIIQLRLQNAKEIMVVPIPADTTCDHEYSVYLNHAFEILGYKI
ncbi:MAG TPA: hypothetical protein VKM55_15720 [Candidatus Lokiarchaeia archaeon]|nr:hypothetical protein [Candidatus Lokiarchaeia archaeon]